jgi:hypothetical protein
MNRNFRSVLPGALAAAFLLAAGHASAAIPADYLGKPYKGTPSIIPGRVELANLDTGGAEVSYHADHNRMNSAGYEPISGNDYRPDEKDLPNICKTNGVNPDVWAEDNTTYPSEADKYWYYMGYAHAVDWVKLTVDVKAAGKYYVSSYWASAGDMWGLSIWFNDGTGTPDPERPKDGINKTGLIEMPGTNDYHKWKKYPKFATVDLSAGLQVMTFHLEKHDHLQYGFLQFDPVDGVTGLGGGGLGAGGSAAGGAGGAAASVGGVSGAEHGAGSPSYGGSSSGGTGSTSNPQPTPGGSNAGGSAGGTPGLGSSGTDANQDSGCTIGHADKRWPAALGLLLAGCALRRRRARA